MLTRKKSNLIRRIIRKGSLICVMLIVSTQAALAASVPDDMSRLTEPQANETSIDNAKNGIVRILVGLEDDNGKINRKSAISGFIINNDSNNVLIVTTLHAVDLGENTRIQVAVKNDSVVEAQIVQKNKQNDFCILSAENSFNDKNEIPLRIDKYDSDDYKIKAGDEVVALAFTSEVGDTSDYRASDVSMQIGSLIKSGGENGGVVDHDAALDDSADGGVLVDEEGYAIGLLNPQLKTSAGTIGAKDITEIDKLLVSAGLPYRSKDKDLMYSELYYRCIEANEKYKKYDKDSKSDLADAYNNALDTMEQYYYDRDALVTALSDMRAVMDNAKEKTSKLWILVYVLAGVILLLLIRLISLMRWNSKHQPKAVPVRDIPAAPPREIPAAPPIDIYTQAQLRDLRTGMMMDIERDSIILGRGTDADFVISGNNKVGRRHALIERRGSAYFLIDLNSANGTYLNNSRVDNRGIVLASGDVIKMAGEQIEFVQR